MDPLLFRYLDEITSHRDRVRLEAALTEALYNLLHAKRIRLFKMILAGADSLVGTAAQLDEDGLVIHDDGMSWPPNTTNIQHYPLLTECLASNGSFCVYDEINGYWRHAYPLLNELTVTGFVTIRREQILTNDESQMVEGLLTVYRNCLALIEYSETDTLTGLLNRKTFDEFLFRILSNHHLPNDEALDMSHTPHRRHGNEELKQHWLGVMDIDRFKRINDNFGHLIGDEVLLMVSNKMRCGFRSLDKLFRFGGEEFVVVLKPTTHEQAYRVFDRFRQAIEGHVFPQVGQVTISIGFAPISLKDTGSVILDNADRALYWAKENGRNQVASYIDLVKLGDLEPSKSISNELELF